MGKRKESWFQQLEDEWKQHNDAIHAARSSQDLQEALEAYREHLPAMIAIHNEVDALFVPSPPRTLWDRLNGTSPRLKMIQERDLFLSVSDTVISTWQDHQELIERSRR